TRHNHPGLSITSSARRCSRGQSCGRSLAVAYTPACGYVDTRAGAPTFSPRISPARCRLPQRLCFRARCMHFDERHEDPRRARGDACTLFSAALPAMRPGELGLGILSYACVLFAMPYELTQHARL
ncbi:hypothetical protein TRAPUB_2386, partial [Trametes pubescens]